MILMRKRIITMVILMILLIVSTQMVSAHGGTYVAYLSQQQVGSYTVDVWGNNERPQTGTLFLEGMIRNATTGVPELECDLLFQATHLENGTRLAPVNAQSPTVQSGFEYRGMLDIEAPGTYQIVATVLDQGGEAGTAVFTMTVYKANTWFKWIVNGLLLIYSLAGLWLLKEGPSVWGFKFSVFGGQ